MRSLLMGVLASEAIAAAALAQTEAYRLVDNAIRIDLPSHWQNWALQNDRVVALSVPVASADLFKIDDQGLRPTFFRRRINAAIGAEQFSYPDFVRASGAIVGGGGVGPVQ